MDIIFDAFSAWNLLGLIIMAIVFLSIGGGIIGYEMYWRIQGVKTKGRILAVHVDRKRKRNADTSRQDDAKEGERYYDSETDSTKEKFGPGDYVGLFLFTFIPLIFIGVGVYFGWKYFSLTNYGELAQGVVVRNKSSWDSEGGTTYHAIIQFRDLRGKEWEVEDNISYGNSPSFSKGTQLEIYYDPDDPEDFVIHNFFHTMTLPLIFSAFGSVFLALIIFGMIGGKNKKSSRSRKKHVHSQGQGSEFYYSVFEYQAPNGDRMEQMSKMGSTGLLNRIPGTEVDLMVLPEKPQKVRRKSVFLLVFGLVFFLPGMFVMYIAVTTFEANYMVFVMVLAGIGFIGFKILNFMKDIPLEELKEGLASIKSSKMEITESGGPKNTHQLTTAEIQERMKSQVKTLRIGAWITVLIAVGLIVGGYYAQEDMRERIEMGVNAQGEVVDMRQKRSSSSDGGTSYTYHAIVHFTDLSGRSVRFEDSMGSSHPMMKVGDAVKVLYVPDNPRDAIIDRGIFNWGLSGGLFAFAILLLWIALHNFRISRKYGGQRYMDRI